MTPSAKDKVTLFLDGTPFTSRLWNLPLTRGSIRCCLRDTVHLEKRPQKRLRLRRFSLRAHELWTSGSGCLQSHNPTAPSDSLCVYRVQCVPRASSLKRRCQCVCAVCVCVCQPHRVCVSCPFASVLYCNAIRVCVQAYFLMKPVGGATPFPTWVFMLITKRGWIWGF